MKRWIIEINTGIETRQTSTDDFESALRIFEKVKYLAKCRGISCDVSLYSQNLPPLTKCEKPVLIETDTVNPIATIKIN